VGPPTRPHRASLERSPHSAQSSPSPRRAGIPGGGLSQFGALSFTDPQMTRFKLSSPVSGGPTVAVSREPNDAKVDEGDSPSEQAWRSDA
jgi:hypothetical protein